MNSSDPYYGQPGRYPMSGQPPQTPMHPRPDYQTSCSPNPPGHPSTAAMTSNGLACAPTRPTMFMNQATSRPDDRYPLQHQKQQFIPVHIREVTRWKSTTIQATATELNQLDKLLSQGFTEIPNVENLFEAAGSLPDQEVEVHTVISTVENQNRRSQPVPPAEPQPPLLLAPIGTIPVSSVNLAPQGHYLAVQPGYASPPHLPYYQPIYYPPSTCHKNVPEGY